MPARSRFIPKLPPAPTGRKQAFQIIKDMRGLNSTDPYGILKPYASPYNRNARMYVPDQNRQVAISTRHGAKFYSVPVGESQTGFIDPLIIIDTLDSVTAWVSTHSLTLNTTNQIQGTGCANIVMGSAGTLTTLSRLNSTVLDLSVTAGKVVIPIFIPTPTSGTVTFMSFFIGSDVNMNNNIVGWQKTTQYNGSPITTNAWNYFEIDLAAAPTSITGTPVRTAIKSLSISLGGASNFQLNAWRVDYITLQNQLNSLDKTVNYINAYAQSFTVSTAGVLTKLDIYVKKIAGSSPLTVKVYANNSGAPGALLATSTIPYDNISTTYGFVSCRFVEAPSVATSTTYWYTLSITDDTNTSYQVSTTSTTTNALSSVNGGINWSAATYSLYYKTYTSTAGGVNGIGRYNPNTGSQVTFFGHGTDIYSVDDSTGAVTSRKSSLSSSATYTRFAQFDNAIFAVNGYNTMQRSTGTTFADVTQAPFVPTNVIVHELKLFITDSTNKNLIRYSDEMDYTTWDAANYIYVPESKSSDPITGWVVFQGNLVVFTKYRKYIVSSVGIENFSVRQALGNKGAVSQEAITMDSNYVYFIAADGKTYRWNGSQDEELSRVIESDFDDIATIDNARLSFHDGHLYYWFQYTGGTVYNRNFVYNTEYKEWFYDTNRYVKGGIVLWNNNDRFLIYSDRAGVIYEATDNHSDLGRPIEFEYYTNYFDLGSPDALKRVRRLYLHLQKTTWGGLVNVGVDIDFADQPYYQQISVKSEGAGGVWGTFKWGTGTWAAKDEYKRYETSVPGVATYFQIRLTRTGAETPVYFIGHSEYFRSRRTSA